MVKQKSVSGGIFLKSKWSADDLPIELLPAPSHVVIPLVQHAGPPSMPCVKIGQHVAGGQMIGLPHADGAVAIHASVSGVVSDIVRYPYTRSPGAFSVAIENNGNDEFASPIPYDKPWQDSSPQELIAKIRLGGIIDAAGNGVPLDSVLFAGPSSPIHTLIVNMVADEPFMSADARLLIEHVEKVFTGIAICLHASGASECLLVVDEKRAPVVGAVTTMLADERFRSYTLLKIKKAHYPIHNERLLIRACTGIELPEETRASEVGIATIGIAAAFAVAEAIIGLVPSCRRVVTVAGPLTGTPKNLLVPVGTPARLLLESCSVDLSQVKKLVFGGILSGQAVQDLDRPITRSVSAILPLDTTFGRDEQRCIGCRRCRGVCPVRLEPARLAMLVRTGQIAELDEWNISECIECGCCAWVCPSKINLVHWLALGKVQSLAMAQKPAAQVKKVAA